MGKLANLVIMIGALVVTYECGRETGARQMFFKYTEAMLELKAKEAEKSNGED